MDLCYEKIFFINSKACHWSGTHPDTKITKRWVASFILVGGHFTSVFLFAVYTILTHDLKNKDFTKICQNGILCLNFIIISFNYIIMIQNKKKIGHLIDEIKFDYEICKQLPIADQQIVSKYAAKGEWICKQWFVLCTAGSFVFTLKNIFLIGYTWYKTGELEPIPIFELSYYFSFLEDNKNTITGCLVIFIYINIYMFSTTLIYVASTPIGPAFMLHACGQLELVKNKIDVLFENDDMDEVNRKLKVISKRLQDIYNFVAELESVLKLTYEMTIKMTCLNLPVTSFEIIETMKQGVITLEFFTFIAGGVLITASPCYYSELLIEKGESVKLAMYSCGWQNSYNKSIRRTILVTLLRAQQPVAIKTPFCVMNLNTLTGVFNQSFALFNLMNAVFK